MGSTNYNASVVGVPFCRISQVKIQNILGVAGAPPPIPCVQVVQEMAILLNDGSNISIGFGSLSQSITFSLDVVNNLTTPIPLVDPITSIPTGGYTTLQQVLGCLHAVAIQQLQIANP